MVLLVCIAVELWKFSSSPLHRADWHAIVHVGLFNTTNEKLKPQAFTSYNKL